MQEYRSIELNLKVGCPVGCLYCPQDTLSKSDYGSQREMKQESLNQIIENLTSNESKAEVFFAAFTEPLVHKDWLEMVVSCTQQKLVTRVVVFTTGYKLEKPQIIRLAKLKKLKVNFHVGHKQNMPQFDDSLWSKLHLIKKYLPHSDFISVGFENDFQEIERVLNQNGFPLKFQKIISRSGNLKPERIKTPLQLTIINQPVTCSKMTTHKRPVIMPDGTALACANDYGCELKIGNLLLGPWENLDFNKVKELQKTPSRNVPCFRDCHYAEPVKPKISYI